MNEVIRARERQLGIWSSNSSFPAWRARQLLGIPTKPDGILVDVGAGASSLVPELLGDGWDVYAVDRLYLEDLSVLRQEVEKTNQQVEPYSQRAEAEEAYGQFLRSFQAHPERYLGGYFSALPVPSDFARWVVSGLSVTAQYKDFELMMISVREMIRVAQPGGNIILAPFLDSSPDIEVVAAHQRLRHEITDMGYECDIDEEVDTFGFSRLRFRKD